LSEQLHISSASSNWLAALRAYLVTVAVADLVWELSHLPLYTLWQTGTPGEKLFAVVHCTAGDLLIALVSLTAGLVLAGHRDWPARRFVIVAVLTFTFGFCYTVFSEWLNVVMRKSWAYSDLMPVVSVFGLRLRRRCNGWWCQLSRSAPAAALAWYRRRSRGQERNGHDEWSDDGRLGNDMGNGTVLPARPRSAGAGDRCIDEIPASIGPALSQQHDQAVRSPADGVMRFDPGVNSIMLAVRGLRRGTRGFAAPAAAHSSARRSETGCLRPDRRSCG
jgi:hypothetical protein